MFVFRIFLLVSVFSMCVNTAVAFQDFFAEANQRIEQHRKSDISVLVVDSSGQPVANAQVDVTMKRHAFRWGTAVVANRINSISTTNTIYKQKILENFNSVVFENDLKWPAWEGAWGPNLGWSQAEQALDWCGTNNLSTRGHYLTWGTPGQTRNGRNSYCRVGCNQPSNWLGSNDVRGLVWR